ncbi:MULTISPECIES: hypothetical protein [Haloferax]|uniref:DUF7282 domain-containing protein n=1 Tax=Haloferax TaxID=2251 RepID=UPI001CDA1C98|nr:MULTISPECIES: hypothetical protein [Haloferax]
MNIRTHIAGILAVAAFVTVAATGVGFAAPAGTTQAVDGPSTQAVGAQYAQVQQQQQTGQCPYPVNESFESYDVGNLSAPSSVQPGETVTVTADITNPNDAPLVQCVEFRLEGDVVERRGWALNPNETETITFEVDTEGLEEGTYIHGVETRDMGEVTTLTVSTEQPATASVQFDDQTTDGNSVVVAEATLSEGGFIAIHNESGDVIGASEYLEPGDQSNVTVDLAEPLTENATLTAMPHLDTNDNEVLDFLTSNGTEDGPYTVDGEPVTDDANVTVEAAEPETPTNETETPTNETETPTNETETPTNETETPTNETETEAPATETETPAEEATASVTFGDQESDGTVVTVSSVSLSEGGFIAIHAEDGSVIGASEYLEPGESSGITVRIDEPLTEDATLTAMPHLDTNDNQELDFITSDGAEDGPYTADGEPVTDTAEITIVDGEMTEEPPTEEESPTEEETQTESGGSAEA